MILRWDPAKKNCSGNLKLRNVNLDVFGKIQITSVDNSPSSEINSLISGYAVFDLEENENGMIIEKILKSKNEILILKSLSSDLTVDQRISALLKLSKVENRSLERMLNIFYT
jgi:hypothetical protein